ncbi:MAG: GMC family oxidoreductase [Chitinophagaceae bacterium]|nr:GMC family oxidoreductase [Anaerolineae bacterium]
MSQDNHYDIIIIGSGAGGGTLTHRLAPSGKRILLLERGDFLPREKDTWNTRSVFTEGKYAAKNETWYTPDGTAFNPSIYYYVGGNTKFYGAALLRLREQDFREIQHGGGISPAWPVSYNDFEPYYTRAEHLYHAHGKHGEDPFDPPSSAEYPYPPISHEPRIQELDDDLRRLGYHPFHLPMGIMIDEANPQKSKCIRCSTCDGYACVVQAKADAHVVCVQPALEYPNVTLLTGAKVKKLETDASGKVVNKVIVEREGETIEFSADIFALCAGAINSAAIMLRSANDQHPNGLANSSDLVGRNYMCHHNSTFIAISKSPNPAIFPKTLGLSDFYFANSDWDYPMGFIQMLGKVDAESLKFEISEALDELQLENMARHSLDFWLQSEDLPDPNNRVTLNANGDIVMSYTKNNHESHLRLIQKLKDLLDYIGCHEHLIPIDHYLGTELAFNLAHQCGTMRFGHDPQTSVLDIHCKAHELDNLYVADASFFVSAGAVNPTLTIVANALRVGDHLLERWG